MTTVGVLDKCVAILDLVRVKPLTATEVSAHTRMSMSTAHRLLQSLEHHNMVARGEAGAYGLGSFFVLNSDDAAREALRQLRDATEESVQLWVRRGPWRVCLLNVDAENELRISKSVGSKILLTDGGSAADALRSNNAGTRVFSSVQARTAGVGSSSVALQLNKSWSMAVCVSYPLARAPVSPQQEFKQVLTETVARLKFALDDSEQLTKFERIISDSLAQS
ncbi:helix-turn-helix domain-containing protein [Saxibacter everestensis]|uniref:Helix-turn-helix domain-containing protein n=1 Tax=Saxibacter everestensis TaxID=2909229 RepID=A0ABY8QTC8_9MICO|nr:helix-turn-helix domain-containing protein [Brevibacteriaceae bacterium ZFBP1038]